MNDVAMTWQNATPTPYLNMNCFGDPGDQNPGNAPRYFSNLRVDGIHNADLNLYKSFVPKEGTPGSKCGRTCSTSPIILASGSRIRHWEILFSGQLPVIAARGNASDFQFGVRFEF